MSQFNQSLWNSAIWGGTSGTGTGSVTARRLIYVPSAGDAHAVMQRLSRAVVPIVTVIRSESESPDVGAWREDTCYVEIKRDRLNVRRLVAITLHHRCSQ